MDSREGRPVVKDHGVESFALVTYHRPHAEEVAFLRLEVAQNHEDLEKAAHYGRELLTQCEALR